MQSAKSRYQLSQQDVEWHKSLVKSAPFERAADAAMLEVANEIPENIPGAKAFLRKFCDLSLVPIKSEPPKPRNVDLSKH